MEFVHDDMESVVKSMIQSQGGNKHSLMSDAVDYYKQYDESKETNDMNSIENQIVAECYLSFT